MRDGEIVNAVLSYPQTEKQEKRSEDLMSSSDNVEALNLCYKLLKRLTDYQLDSAYGLLLSNFGNPTKIANGSGNNKSINKKVILIDFDGPIHKCTSPWTTPIAINDGPQDGIFKFLESIVHSEEFCAVIYSSRSKYPGFKEACIEWFKKWGCPEDIYTRIEFTSVKLPAHITIDDRAFLFNGVYPTLEYIRAFKSITEQE